MQRHHCRGLRWCIASVFLLGLSTLLFADPGHGDDVPKSLTFTLKSSAVENGGALPREFTGDGAGATLPLEWSGAPPGTKSYAVVMHHIPGPGDVKWCWILYNLRADVTSLPKNVKGVGTLGNNSVNRRVGYAPPHSKGPGAKTYILTVYALSAPPKLDVPPEQVNRAILLDAINDITLASAELKVTYDRTAIISAASGGERGRPDAMDRPGKTPPPREPDGGDGRGAPPFHVMPREIEEQLNLSDEQRQKLDALEQEANEKLRSILTPEQAKILSESRPPRD